MIDLSQYSWQRLCPELYNLKDFKETHPTIDPVSQGEAYHKYWKSVAKKILEGLWGHDYDPLRNLGGYRYISPVCYLYINGWVIDLESEDSKARDLKPPRLVDIVLIHSYAWHCARGFSGFENDLEVTCCRPVEKLHKNIPLNAIDQLIIKRAGKNIFKPDGELKKYVNAYDYLWQTFEKPLGRSLYDNEANNLINIQARRGGKTSFFACASYHEFLTYGKKYYDQDYLDAPRGTNTTIVSSIKDKSEKFFKMVQDGANYLNTELGSFNGSPGYFHRQHYGSFSPNSTYYHGVEITKTVNKKKVTTKYGSGATLSHLLATIQNPDVGAGGAQSVGGIEEFGLMKNSAHVLKSGFEPAMTGTLKFGSLFGIGTGGNIDKVHSSKDLMENPLAFKCIGFKDVLEGRANLIGLFVPSYMTKFAFKDENGNTLYEEAWEFELAQIQDLIDNGDRRTLELHLQANPLVLSHVYMGAKGSHFPTAYIGEALRRMDIHQLHKKLGTPGKLQITDYTTRTVTFTPDHLGYLTPIVDYKTDNYINVEGCVMVYEPPDPYEHYERFYPPIYHNLYKVVYDSIKDPGGGPSFACIQVWKGIGKDLTRMQDTLVAEYIGRMDNPNDMDYIACCLAIWYGARILYEQNVNTLLNYCTSMEMSDLLQPTPYESIKKAIKEPKKKYKTGMVMSDELKSKADLWGSAWLITEARQGENSEKRYRCDYLCSRRLLQEYIFYEAGKNFDCISTWRIYIVWIQQELEPNEEIQKARLNEAKKIAQRNASTLIQNSPEVRSIWRV